MDGSKPVAGCSCLTAFPLTAFPRSASLNMIDVDIININFGSLKSGVTSVLRAKGWI